MSLEFHPTETSIIAGGTFNGQLIIWDLENTEDPVIASTDFTEDNHLESIAKVTFFSCPNIHK
jgi:WD repeat-containing protein 34